MFYSLKTVTFWAPLAPASGIQLYRPETHCSHCTLRALWQNLQGNFCLQTGNVPQCWVCTSLGRAVWWNAVSFHPTATLWLSLRAWWITECFPVAQWPRFGLHDHCMAVTPSTWVWNPHQLSGFVNLDFFKLNIYFFIHSRLKRMTQLQNRV